jgi:hypothetical protein
MEIKTMKYVLVGLVALFGLTACTSLDAYLPREVQCMLLESVKVRAAEEGVPVEEVLTGLAAQGVELCPAATEEEAVEDGFTVVE